eukprot:TRINITY_DN263_c1_g1_i9.p1 TRINITY_DN263_c1_g1~~TRINITY_DN263_c1_g1_i9.p1  ORF type:complete len:148 (+),score=7.57 TRINITY_DN263_c1_g1_i9:56-445(+)
MSKYLLIGILFKLSTLPLQSPLSRILDWLPVLGSHTCTSGILPINSNVVRNSEKIMRSILLFRLLLCLFFVGSSHGIVLDVPLDSTPVKNNFTGTEIFSFNVDKNRPIVITAVSNGVWFYSSQSNSVVK